MKHIIRAVIFIIILYFIENSVRYSGYKNIIIVALAVAFIYFIAAVTGYIRSMSSSKKQPQQIARNTSVNTKKNTGGLWFFLILLAALLVYVWREILGTYSFTFFVFSDNLLQLSNSVSPIVFWGILGLFVGAVYGSFVAFKKYKLRFTVSLIPIIILLLFIAILYAVNKPANAIAAYVSARTQTEIAYNSVTVESAAAPSVENMQYKIYYLLDDNDKTAWITDYGEGDSGEKIQFAFTNTSGFANKNLQCIGFRIKNGYRKSLQVWSNFARLKNGIIKKNGTTLSSAKIGDSNSGFEEIKFAPVAISNDDKLVVEIVAVYPGKKYANRVAITELVPIIQYQSND